MKSLLVIIIPFFVALSCSSNTAAISTKRGDRENIIIIIYKSAPPDTVLSLSGARKFGINGPILSYTDSSEWTPILHSFRFQDTIIIKPKAEYILFQHKYNVLTTYDYLLKRGDTILLKYDGNRPVVTVVNRTSLKYDFNFEKEFGAIGNQKKFTFLELFYTPYLQLNWANHDFKTQLSAIKSDAYLKAKLEQRMEMIFLDSIYKKKEISENIYAYYKDKISFILLTLDVLTDNLSFASAKEISKHFSASVPLLYSHYYEFLRAVVENYYTKRASVLRLSTTSINDYRTVFDSIAGSNFLPEVYKVQLLYSQLDLIARYFPAAVFTDYFSKFKAIVKDQSFIDSIASKYFLELDKLRSSKDTLYLMTNNRQKITLNEIIKKSKGNLIYIDFWASWCAPCRKALPSSLKLRESYRNININFIYISIDQSYDDWKKASEKEGLQKLENNYLVVNG